ncbi:hypothetical protein VOLCADRAFT_93448 [Volvox carteri f. nagariensis]|uniref:Polycystin cation channel PKD1/PKD2 domain-containing protein n=1 Tax=Volvox carteri f. nagariensis TaxID=3068 RepID=D8U257_VOLCA|nr:uncharacterized protein VOLCADRAFT_93448 [Volvox carteri f. nagariensis]EFJ46305.1 hypothetical protein VOLCADRAFT_93448 [Volvox carteri f. nagariensis]|eukprot:XP_002952752.1 hypothetical protein VOLCADRAFT_93448 [Volvox carteri f. nagariensis]
MKLKLCMEVSWAQSSANYSVLAIAAILYTQRSAEVAYKVHSTVESVVLPSDSVMQNTDEVYDWLKKLLTEVWKDPVCGDGLCEAPFEFASYSRFGCRADCGKLNEVQNLTTIQLDVYYDFSHPVGSIPASDLMQQASWNLCPVSTPYSSDCYYDSDINFERLSGEQHFTLDDAPDGEWNLVVKRDIFNKIRGAVRDATLVKIAGYYYKIYVAIAAAASEQAFEKTLLQQAASFSSMDFWTYANSSIRAGYPNETEYLAAYTWVRNATCTCSTVDNNGTAFGETNMTLFLNQSVSATDANKPFNLTYSEYIANPYYCPSSSAIQPYIWKTYNDSAGNWTRTLMPVNTTNGTAYRDWCAGGLALSLTWRTNMTNTVQRLLIDRRLGDQKTTGKIAMRNNVSASLRTDIIANYPELFGPVFSDPSGTVALQDPISARLDYLMPLYVDGTISPQAASLNMTRRFVYGSNVHLLDLGPRALARMQEVDTIQAQVLGFPIPAPRARYSGTDKNYTFSNLTVGDVWSTFILAAANTTRVPPPTSDALGSMSVKYNLVAWAGNTTAYMRCDLKTRAPAYIGLCVAMNNTCVATVNDTVPYNCEDVATGAAIPGSLANQTYRLNCEVPCDRRFDCNTICECFSTCLPTEYCECEACKALQRDATSDNQFVDIRSLVTGQAAAAVTIASLGDVSSSSRRSMQASGRQLQQTNSSADIQATLNNVLSQVGTVATTQATISQQMDALKVQVDRANAIAEARAKDDTVLNAINAGRTEIAAGQAAVEKKLDEILGKQQEALLAAQSAAAALSAIKGLAERQAAAQANLEQAVNSQLSAIKVATYREIISLTQALALWKRARRDRALTLKAAQLANTPCNSAPTASNTFKLDNQNEVDTTTSRERNVGLTNRVISGLLLHQTRTNVTECPKSKFDKIQKTCTGPQTIASFGVDPVFKRGTTSYNPDFDDVNDAKVLEVYNCTKLSAPTYDITFLNQTTNLKPYCAELYNPQKLPYAFHFFPLEGKEDGFPIYFDINLSQQGAQAWYTYINEGLYLDQNTRQMTAELVTYNAQLRIFSYYFIRFFFSDGGSIKITHRLNTVRVELYNSYSDDVRFAFEIILSMIIFGMLIYNLFQIGYTQVTRGNFLKYFLSGWHWVEFASNGLLTACMIIWWVFKEEYAKTFNIMLRYDVYNSLSPSANFLALNANGTQLIAANAAFSDLRELVDMLNWYFALNGINILLLIARVLKLMDFQPRLGVVTRSLWLAGPDLVHFAIVAGMVFVGYAMMAHLIFGNAIVAFATFGDSINTCFEILLGNIDVNDDLRALGGLQSVAAVRLRGRDCRRLTRLLMAMPILPMSPGALFFWSYELLVFMVLLNFLLAIIVDAFSEVKEKTQETVGIHTELFTLLRDKWRSMMGRCSSNYISDAKLGDLLRQWAGEEDTDRDDKATLADKRKLLTILNEDMDEETLLEIFKECLRDAPDTTDRSKVASRSLLSRMFPRRKVGVEATEEELAQAAHYIVDRFGMVPDDDDDDDDSDDGRQDSPPLPPAAPAAAVGALGPSREAVLEKERDQLAQALERLAEVQRELAEGQRNLMNGQKQLSEQQSKLVQLMNEQPPAGN